jgi:calcineurin B homologous protein 1
MGSNSSILLQKDEIQKLSSETGFNANQIKRLYNRFHSLDKRDTGFLTKDDLLLIPELHVNPLHDRIIEVLIEDHGSDSKLNFCQFVRVFATFRRGKTDSNASNTKTNKLKFLFRMYDRDKDERINKNELMDVLKMLVGPRIPAETLNSIADRTIAELDTNGENSITFKDFCKTLEKIDLDETMSMKFLT